MTSIYFNRDRAAIRSYSSSSKGSRSIVKIEIETNDPYELGHLLEEIGRAQKECLAARKPAPAPKPAKPAKTRAIGQQVPLRLPYYGDHQE